MILLSPGEAVGESLSGNYRSGDIAVEDIVTPIELDVLDAGATALARHAAISRMPPAYRSQNPVQIEVVEAFESTRERFVEGLEEIFGTRQLSHRQANSTRFRDFRMRFQRENHEFPVGNLLGLTWALGRDDSRLLAPILDVIEDAYSGWMVLEGSDGDLPNKLVLYDAAFEFTPAPGDPVEAGRLFTRPQIVDLGGVRDVVREGLVDDYRPVAAFVAALLGPNARFDLSLTEALRQKTAEAIRVVGHFDAGDVLVKKDERVTDEIAKALRGLDMRTRTNPFPSGIVASHPGVPVYRIDQETDSGITGLALGFLTCALLLLLVMFTWFFHQRRGTGLVAVQGEPGSGYAIPEGLAAQLARELRDRVVQSLYTQRDGLLAAERSAIMSVRDLEDRLEKLQPRILARIQAYEDRIADLENQLAKRKDESRDLIRGRIDAIRRKLNNELARHDIILN